MVKQANTSPNFCAFVTNIAKMIENLQSP